MFGFYSSPHAAACAAKQRDIAEQVDRYAAVYGQPLSTEDAKVLSLSLAELVDECSNRHLKPSAVLSAFAKRCLIAHAATNCLSDLMFDEALSSYAPNRPLSGVPISIKDVVEVAGYDTTLGFSSKAHHQVTTSAPIIQLLKEAGAILHVKTTVPAGLLSFETTSDLFGRTSNPYHPNFSPGGSTGGGGALLAYGGSKIEIATDVGGSVRYPPAFCGVYGMRCSSGRFPSLGIQTCSPGLLGFQTPSPMAKSLDDLQVFWERLIQLRPWDRDHTCVPIPWRPVDFVLEARKPKWAVIWNDGLITPTPACNRALICAVNALRATGHEVVDFDGPSLLEVTKIGFPLAFADGGSSVMQPRSPGEMLDPALALSLGASRIPLFIKRLVAFALRWLSWPRGRNDAFADLLVCMHPLSVARERELVVQLEDYRARWNASLKDQGIDFVLSVPCALPPLPKGSGATATLLAANYAFFYNILDYTAGVVPITFVDKDLDALPPKFEQSETYARFNEAERNIFSLYDPEAMHGLPLAVQIGGSRFEEEKVLEGMQVIERALKETGKHFVQKEF